MSKIEQKAIWLENETKKQNPDTVVIIVQALPTIDDKGNQYIGGTGESFVMDLIEKGFADIDPIKVTAGQAMRKKIAQEVIQENPTISLNPEGLLDENLFESERNKRKEDGNLDRIIDEGIQEQVADLISNQNTRLVLLEAKLAGQLILENYRSLFEKIKPTMVILSVDAANTIATQRFASRQIKENGTPEFFKALQRRRDRYQMDKQTYKSAHGIGSYSRDWLLGHSHLVVDNSEYLDTEEKQEQFTLELVEAINSIISQKHPNLVTPWLKNFSNN